MPVLKPSGSDFTALVKTAAQYVPAGRGGKASKSGRGEMLAPLSLGAVARASLVAIRANPSSTVLSIPYINPPAGPAGTPAPPMFSPTSIPGCQLWLDGADASTVTLSGSNVSQWRDKSTASNNFSNSSTAATYSNNALNFNGTFGGLSNASQNGFVTGSSNSFVIFTVFNTPSESTDRGIFSYGNFINNTYTVGYVMYIGANTSNLYSTAFAGTFGAYTAISFNNTMIAADSWSNNGSASNYTHFGWMNGTRFTSDGATVGNMNITLTNAYVGATILGAGAIPFIGAIQEVLYYSGSLTTVQRQTIEGYLAWKWGQQASLPGDHPYKSVAPTP